MKQADIDHNEIIEMVNQAGCKSYTPPPTRAVAGVSMTFAQLEAFAKLVTEKAVRESSAEYRLGWNDGQIAEREACAKTCEAFVMGSPFAAAIRARKDKE